MARATTTRFMRPGPGRARSRKFGGAEGERPGERVADFGQRGRVAVAGPITQMGQRELGGRVGVVRQPGGDRGFEGVVEGRGRHSRSSRPPSRALSRDWAASPASTTSACDSGCAAMPAAALVTNEMPSTSSPASGGDRFERGRHAHQGAADRPGHAHLGRSFVGGAVKLAVDAFFECRVDGLGQVAQGGAVHIGQVDETRPDQGSGAGQVDVVGQQHGGTGRVADAAATVGEHQPPSTGRSGVVRTPCTTGATPRPSYKWVRPVNTAATEPAGVRTSRRSPPWPATTGALEAGQLGERTLVQVLAQPFGRLRPTRTQHQGQVDGVDAETGAQGVGGLLSQNVGIAHSSDDICCGSAAQIAAVDP